MMVVLLSKLKFASLPFAGFHSNKAAPCFAENHLFLLYLLRNNNLPDYRTPGGKTHKPELEEIQCCSCVLKGQAGGRKEGEARQPHISTWEDDGGNNPGKDLQDKEDIRSSLNCASWIVLVYGQVPVNSMIPTIWFY